MNHLGKTFLKRYFRVISLSMVKLDILNVYYSITCTQCVCTTHTLYRLLILLQNGLPT